VTQLPNYKQAVIEVSKIQDYLLNIEHPVGGSKARFFMAFGFMPEQWDRLHDALIEHSRSAHVIESRQKIHGLAYALRGRLLTPDRRNPIMISVWQIDTDHQAPRFITAYPADIE
jgi:hypothetical protein